MATSDQYLQAYQGVGSLAEVCIPLTLTVNGNTTVKNTSATIPVGSVLKAITYNVPTAISGSPTHTYLNVGLTDGGGEIVANLDVKAQGNGTCTIVAGIDQTAQFATANTPLFVELTTSGGTSSAGGVNVYITYCAPRH